MISHISETMKQKRWINFLRNNKGDFDDLCEPNDIKKDSGKYCGIGKIENPKSQSLLWIIGIISIVFLLTILLINWWVSLEPNEFDVEKIAIHHAKVTDPSELPRGYIFASTLMRIGETLLKKNGGYMTNDVTPPMIFLNDMPNWEYGVLQMLRYGTQGLRNHLARAQSQSREDKNLAMAFSHFNSDNNSWQLPSSESEFAKGIKALERYMKSLKEKRGSGFYSRADNLRAYLEVIEKRLGGLIHFSSNSNQISNIESPSTRTSLAIQQTPQLDNNNVFFKARGVCWALLHIMKAIEYDFHDTLIRKQGEETIHEIITELRKTQSTNDSTLATNIARAANATKNLYKLMRRS